MCLAGRLHTIKLQTQDEPTREPLDTTDFEHHDCKPNDSLSREPVRAI